MENKKVRSLELFYGPACPYCHKVINFMQSRGIENVTMHNIGTDPEAAKRLVEVGGKRQIPCLFIDGEPLYESNDIIRFLGTLAEEPEQDIAR